MLAKDKNFPWGREAHGGEDSGLGWEFGLMACTSDFAAYKQVTWCLGFLTCRMGVGAEIEHG